MSGRVLKDLQAVTCRMNESALQTLDTLSCVAVELKGLSLFSPCPNQLRESQSLGRVVRLGVAALEFKPGQQLLVYVSAPVRSSQAIHFVAFVSASLDSSPVPGTQEMPYTWAQTCGHPMHSELVE